MSLWGKSDNLTIPGAPSNVTVVGAAGSEFWTAAGTGITAIPTGTTIILGSAPVGSAGMAVIESVLDVDLVKVNIMSSVPSSVVGAQPAVYSQQPIQISHDPGFNGWSNPNGVTESGAAVALNPDFAEIGRTQMAAGVSTDTMNALQVGQQPPAANIQFALDHSGWVGVMTYMSLDPETGISTLRVKKEVYVAMSGIETGNRPYPDTFLG